MIKPTTRRGVNPYFERYTAQDTAYLEGLHTLYKESKAVSSTRPKGLVQKSCRVAAGTASSLFLGGLAGGIPGFLSAIPSPAGPGLYLLGSGLLCGLIFLSQNNQARVTEEQALLAGTAFLWSAGFWIGPQVGLVGCGLGAISGLMHGIATTQDRG